MILLTCKYCIIVYMLFEWGLGRDCGFKRLTSAADSGGGVEITPHLETRSTRNANLHNWMHPKTQTPER